MMDFTNLSFYSLLQSLKSENKTFQLLKNFLTNSSPEVNSNGNNYSNRNLDNKTILLRHDVDRKPLNSLDIALLEYNLGITGAFYFRIVPESFNEKIIEQIAKLGHEIGYHYEEMDLVYGKWKMENGKWNRKIKEEDLIDKAYELFCSNLEKMRQIADIKTICMHGSPRSPFDNKAIWKKYNYRDFGIIGEPYFDINWNEFAYLTDTGRRWNGNDVSIRDKVQSRFKFNFKSTQDIVDNIKRLPDKIMFTIHPQRWTNKPLPWIKEYIGQNGKNVVKKFIVAKTLRD